MSTSIRYVRIYLHTPDRQKLPVGHLSVYGDLIRVSFDESYISNPLRPTLSLAYRGSSEAQTLAILRAEKDMRVARNDGKLPVYFQNLLPEAQNRQRLAKERQCGTEDEFELLVAAGHDLMGAIEVEPIAQDDSVPDSVRLWHTTLGKDVVEPGFVEYPVEDAFAIPGVVVKFSALQDGRRYLIKRHGAAGSYILKLPTTRHPDLVEIEATGFALLKALNIDCAEAEIIAKENADLPEHIPFAHLLAVKRFDRGENGTRIHMEEFAQILQYAPKHKYGKDLIKDYSSILNILESLSSQPDKDTVEFVKRFVAFILMGNTDAHLKNWAVIYSDGINLQLSPAYDPVSVSSLFDRVPLDHYGLNREIDRQLTAFTWGDMDGLLTAAKVTRKSRLMKIAKDTVKKAKVVWPEILLHAPVSVRNCIEARLGGGVEIAK
ncbi:MULTISPECIES: type II toxin-antitoxin system HipA family toxin [unclassified Undibacterium]|uniref:type II toxin-antitoxin system HipA family toxin n=1 Tax=unclassified Undibacterium TaxID=2630295 RepID=UPI002AC968C6|nr:MULTISPECIES: type II toxin-antitoxin system HipA family toxin [unclassified Undibacterium]MEB0138814.1 type II toxin-antitoxin system HipA family toxin [Undibacterium sp. CCC2.1]MEB0170710.1 type II toxin-antitoxin system HipA family toxin [Undibacterium sp. CCC1.1]MEB0174599.1 type II toxin-antitoxin system HipA family toxin [Undibacterium sp. CCC3.4]MEB0213796.1 type II toxin-antitoxin system HipA family toxin [Undibacterium sp. 5I2]WPX42524.1 type II toxin-antitoxin system HipA family t